MEQNLVRNFASGGKGRFKTTAYRQTAAKTTPSARAICRSVLSWSFIQLVALIRSLRHAASTLVAGIFFSFPPRSSLQVHYQRI